MKTLICLISLVFVSCAGYQLGGAKPPSLSGVKTITVPMFRNGTLHPRAEAIATSAVAGAFVTDGTYRIAGEENADAVLEGKVATIEYSNLRSSRLDSSLAEELVNTVKIDWELLDANDRTKVLASGSSEGSSSFYVDSNLQTARQNALPDAFERAGQKLVSKLALGY
ncbi:LPS assembly lipoprotein LptE [Luteolibacter sp. AS25]|uniref:LPS assembly lipoprotein LptE n=1 Tax=Luteolibacter sp. AS25 TaxID=3135776 RepID=UPI00398AD07B